MNPPGNDGWIQTTLGINPALFLRCVKTTTLGSWLGPPAGGVKRLLAGTRRTHEVKKEREKVKEVEEEGGDVKRSQNERAERWGEGHKRGWMAGGGRGGRRSGPEINSNRRWAKSHQQQVNLGKKKSRRRWRRWRLKSSLRKPARPCPAAPSTWGGI